MDTSDILVTADDDSSDDDSYKPEDERVTDTSDSESENDEESRNDEDEDAKEELKLKEEALRKEQSWQKFQTLMKQSSDAKKRKTEDQKCSEPSLDKPQTKIVKFAGEEIVVEKGLLNDAVSNNRSFKTDEGQQKVSEAVTTASESLTSHIPKRRKQDLTSLVANLSKNTLKLSTLEKTRLDWQQYKRDSTKKPDENIVEELNANARSKDNYIERQAFLKNVEMKENEMARESRLKRMNKRSK